MGRWWRRVLLVETVNHDRPAEYLCTNLDIRGTARKRSAFSAWRWVVALCVGKDRERAQHLRDSGWIQRRR